MERYKTITQMSEMTGLDRRTIKIRLQSLHPSEVKGKAILYDMYNATALIMGMSSNDDKTNINAEIKAEELKFQKISREKIELQVAKIKGDQVPIEDVAQIVEREYSAVRSQLVAIPNKVCFELAVIEDPNLIQEKLQDAINECLTELKADKNFSEQYVPEIEDDLNEPTIDSEVIGSESENSQTETKDQSD